MYRDGVQCQSAMLFDQNGVYSPAALTRFQSVVVSFVYDMKLKHDSQLWRAIAGRILHQRRNKHEKGTSATSAIVRGSLRANGSSHREVGGDDWRSRNVPDNVEYN
jgi:hypothetical protein